MKKNNNNNNEKKNCAEPFFGYCPNYIVRKKVFVLQDIDCIATWVCSSPRCIAIGRLNCIAIWWF